VGNSKSRLSSRLLPRSRDDMKHLVLLSVLSALATASPTRSSSGPLLALAPRSSSSSSSVSLSTSTCAQYLSTIGVSTLSDLYYLDRACADAAGFSPGTDGIVQLDQPLTSTQAGRLSRLVWLHLPRLDNSDPSSFTPETFDLNLGSSSTSSQHTFNAPLPSLPTRLVSLPTNGDVAEGSIYLLSSDSTLALEQLDLLTSHPSTALLTLVSIPSPSLSPEAQYLVDGDGPRFPEVPKRDVERVQDWLHKLEFEPLLSAILKDLKVKEIEKDVKVLSGEDQSSLKGHERVSLPSSFRSRPGPRADKHSTPCFVVGLPSFDVYGSYICFSLATLCGPSSSSIMSRILIASSKQLKCARTTSPVLLTRSSTASVPCWNAFTIDLERVRQYRTKR
jgi:hypothetical protein